MAEKLSTYLRNYILGGGSYREAFKDSVMLVYTGTPPDDADDAASGTQLAVISSSGGAVLSTTYSVPSTWSVTIPGAHVSGTYILTVTSETTAYTCSFDTEATGSEGHASNDTIARGLAREVVNHCPQVFAIAEGANSKLYIQSRVPGINLAVADGGGTVTIVTFAEIIAETAANTVRFTIPSSGSMGKDALVWSDTVLVTGVAGYFRIVTPVDLAQAADTTFLYPRLQGSISTSGAELNLSNTSLTAAATLTIDNYTIGQPAE